MPLQHLQHQDWAETGRKLGYDMARFGVKSDFTDEFIEQGKKECTLKKNGDIFDRKQVRLRIGAYRRQIPFAPEITAAQLRFITEVVPRCPLTLEAYDKEGTFGAEDNWSFDRVDNNVGYLLSNIMPMTTKANLKKGTLGWDEICEQVTRHAESKDTVEMMFWYRLRHLYAPFEVSRCVDLGIAGPTFAVELMKSPPLCRLTPYTVASVGAHFINTLVSFRGHEFAVGSTGLLRWMGKSFFDESRLGFSAEIRRRSRKLLEAVLKYWDLHPDDEAFLLNDLLLLDDFKSNAQTLLNLVHELEEKTLTLLAAHTHELYQSIGNMINQQMPKVEEFKPLPRFR